MRVSHRSPSVPVVLAAMLAANLAVCRRAAAAANPLDLAEERLVTYVAKLADLHCNEMVLQEKLTPDGHVEAREQSRFDYLVMMTGDSNDFQLNESRLEAPGAKHKNLPMLVTAGFSTLLLVFHPYYRDSFELTPEAEQVLDGRPVLPFVFRQIPGRRSLAALVLRDREYPLQLQGTAWIDEQTGQVWRMDATLENDMSDLGLRSLTVRADYRLTELGKSGEELALPATAVVDVQTPKQHWRNTHTFDRYKSFSTEAEQDPNVKVHEKSANKTDTNTNDEVSPDPKEKP